MQENRALMVSRFVELVVQRHGRNDPGQKLGNEHSEQAADKGEHQRFQQKLNQDMPRTGANGFAQPDFAGPLRD